MILRLLKLSGDSLAPEYQFGDFVFISKIPYFFTSPTPGDVIAFHQPGYGWLIKRIQEVLPDDKLIVIGSHPDSIDSRDFGPIDKKNMLGKVIWHIHRR